MTKIISIIVPIKLVTNFDLAKYISLKFSANEVFYFNSNRQ